MVLIISRKETLKFISKPRTAFFHGREDDEPLAPQDIYADKNLAFH
jgi:hypothetical protein